MQAVPRVAFGVIADIQFADAEDGYDFGGCRRRYYRNSLRLLREAVRAWAAESPPIDFVVQLGDSIDGQNAWRGEADSALKQVLEVLGQLSVPVHHAWGNHELYNFSRARLVHTGLYSRPAGGSDGPPDRECHAYHCSPAAGLRLVVLDTYDVSTLGTEPGSLRYQESLQVLREKNSNDDLNSPEGTSGLAGTRAAQPSLSGAPGADSGMPGALAFAPLLPSSAASLPSVRLQAGTGDAPPYSRCCRDVSGLMLWVLCALQYRNNTQLLGKRLLQSTELCPPHPVPGGTPSSGNLVCVT